MTPPARPTGRRERAAHALFRLFSPRLPELRSIEPPAELGPFERRAIARRGRAGSLSALVFPAAGAPRGAILFLHPWMEWGAAYFFRRGRLQAACRAGYEAWVLDLGGFGASSRPDGFYDRDIEDALAAIASRSGGRPLFVWGVSSGGYWAHPVMSRGEVAVAGAFFEDVSAHLFEWSWRMMPQWGIGFLLFRVLFPRFYRWLDVRRHAPYLGVRAAAYVSGELDRGVRPDDTRALAAAANAVCLIVPDAGHLEAIKRRPSEVIGLALSIFERALASGS